MFASPPLVVVLSVPSAALSLLCVPRLSSSLWRALLIYRCGDVERHPGPRPKQHGVRPPLPASRGRAVGKGTRRDRDKYLKSLASWLAFMGIAAGVPGLLEQSPQVVNTILDSYGKACTTATGP